MNLRWTADEEPKSLADRKNEAVRKQLAILNGFLWAFENISPTDLDKLLKGDTDTLNNYLGWGQFQNFWPAMPRKFAEGTSWDSFKSLKNEIEDLVALGDELDQKSSPEEIFAFLSGGTLRDSLLKEAAVYDGEEFEGAFLERFETYIEEQIPEETSPRSIPDAVGEPIPPVVEPETGAGSQTLPPEGPASQYPEPFAAPAPVDPNESGQAGGGETTERDLIPGQELVVIRNGEVISVGLNGRSLEDAIAEEEAVEGTEAVSINRRVGINPPEGGLGGGGEDDSVPPGKSDQFTKYFDDLLSNDFFKQPGWEVTTDPKTGEPLPRGMTVGQYLDENPDLSEAYFNILAKQAKSWDTFRINQAVLFGQTEGEVARTLEDKIKEVRKALSNFGVNLDEVDEATIIDIARNAFIMGWTELNGELDQALYDNAELAITNMAKGDHASVVSQLRTKARQYMLEIDDATLDLYAQQINTGMASLSGIAQGFAQMARGNYPALNEIMDQGFLPETYFAPFQNAATGLLERPIKFFGDDRNMFDVIAKGVPDGELGFRPMTIPEAQTYIRSLPEWAETKNARQRGRSVVESIMNKFGAVSSTHGIKAPMAASARTY